MSCCHQPEPTPSCLGEATKKRDYLLLIMSSIIVLSYALSSLSVNSIENIRWLNAFTDSVYDLINIMFWGVALGIIFIGIIGRVPREFVIAILGGQAGVKGILRATIAGVLLDLCSHGVLMVGSKLYERGATVGQVMAFLIASPWNSFSFTLILWAMVGFKWMVTFLLLSMVIAIVSGLIFEALEKRQILPTNPNRVDLPEGFNLLKESKEAIRKTKFDTGLVKDIIWSGLLDSRMVMRWIFFGVVIAALIRTFASQDQFQTWFGPTIAGLGLTLLVATIMEVCSEGTLPVAADLLTRARAPGNGLTFLMAGVATDYTEFMVLRETTRTWKIPLFLPLVTLPQILIISFFLNSL